jgi:hypothetical protein
MSRIVKAPMLDVLAAGSSRTSLHEPPDAREPVRARLPATANPRVLNLEKALRASIHLGEAYFDVPGHAPIPLRGR